MATPLPTAPIQQVDPAQHDQVAPHLAEARRLIELADAEQMLSGHHSTAAIREVTERLIAHAGILVATDLRDHWLAASDLIGKAGQLRRIQTTGSLPNLNDDAATSAVNVAPSITVAPAGLQTATAKHERVIGLLLLYLQHLAGVKGLREESAANDLAPRPPPVNLFAFGPSQKVNASELARELHHFAHNRADRKAENKLNTASGLDEETIRKVLGASLKRFDQPVAKG